ncbi:uncharacterized protein LOC116617370 [Nematostella vectensis]|uniref:uncharacterized protein LOC116617370 n=1 Tax=Nematostella vectensis TaxID=45351 RepID=UPI002076DF3A|nr:uncharacterized protein LOC116617370 [Nematostella vectensis]
MTPRALLCVTLVVAMFGNPADARFNAADKLMQMSERAIEMISMQDTVLAIKARTNSIRAFNHMKQGDKEKAQMSMYRAMVGLTMVNGAGGLVVQNPMTMVFVNHMKKRADKDFAGAVAAWKKYNTAIKDGVYGSTDFLAETTKLKDDAIDVLRNTVKNLPDSDDLVKTLRRASKWAKVAKYIDFLGPWFDVLSIGLDSMDLYDAIKDGNTPGIVSASLGIASSVVGLATVAAVAFGVVTGGVGLLALGALSACLGLAGTIVELVYQDPCCNQGASIDPLIQLKEAWYEELKHSKEYLDRFPKEYKCHDFYESNPALMQIRETTQNTNPLKLTRDDTANYDAGAKIVHGNNGNVGSEWEGYVLVRESILDGTFVILDTKLAGNGNYKLRGADIRTYRYLHHKYADFVMIGDFWNLEIGQKINIDTGGGNDTIHINGPIGQPTRYFDENTLTIDTCEACEALNTISFSNLKTPKDSVHSITGAFFSAKTNHVGLWYSPDILHKFGTITGPINMIIGSSYDDLIELDRTAFYVEQTEGANKYMLDASSFMFSGSDFKYYELVDSSESYKLSGKQPELVVCSYNKITIKNFDWTDEGQILKFRVNDRRRSIRFQSLTEPKVSIYQTDSYHDCVYSLKKKNPVKTFDMTMAKKVDTSSNQKLPDFEFVNRPYGNGGDEYIRFLKPAANAVPYLFVNMGGGNDTVILTEDLMTTIINTGCTFELREESGKDWMYIRQGFYKDVELQDVEMIANENRNVLVDLRKPVEGTIDLKAKYEMARPNDWP